MKIRNFMARFADESGKFDRIKNPPSTHRDLCAILILSKFMSNPRTSVINSIEYDRGTEDGIIVFEPSIHEVETMATEEQVIDLIRCGVRYNGEYHALVMSI